MIVTIVRQIFLHDIELNISDIPTQEEINKAIEEVMNDNDLEWDFTDYIGYERVKAYDNYSGCLIYDSMERLDYGGIDRRLDDIND